MYTIHQESDGRGVHIICTGIVTPDRINATRYHLLRDPQFAAHRYQLWDCLSADSHRLTGEDVRSFAINAAAHATNGRRTVRVAIIAPPHFFQGEDRLFHIFSTVWTRRLSQTFTTLDDARAWAQRATPKDQQKLGETGT